MKKILYTLSVLIWMVSCDDPVDIALQDTEPFLVVDAWLTHTADTQKIALTYTRSYFDNGNPEPILGADVSVGVIDNNAVTDTIVFTDIDSDGVYEWVPPAEEFFGEIGTSYVLNIEALGNTYNAFSEMGDVPPIDSITFEFNEQEIGFSEDWYYAEFWSRDLPGVGNTYWIKAFVNDTLLSDPEDINLAYDAAFSLSGAIDSLVFIQPIRTAITPFVGDVDEPSPFALGDKLKVEIHAITNEAWFFLNRVRDETVRNPGFAQLFANPLANVVTNVAVNNENAQVVGFFNVASVSSLEVIMSEDNIVDRVPE